MAAGGNGHSAKRTPKEMDRLAVAAARLHFEDGLGHAEIATRLTVGAGEVAGLVRRARRNGLVTLTVGHPALPGVDAVVGPMLEAISGVRTVVAVKPTPAGSTAPATAVEETPASPDRALHQMIAAGAAHFLWERFRDHDRIAVGAGRAVRFTVDALHRCAQVHPRSFRGLDIVSLTGTPEVRRDPHDLDSDAIASELGHVLQLEGDRIQRVSFPYVTNTPHSDLKRVGSRLMEPKWDRERVPDVAILGLGILDARHHLVTSRRSDPMLAPVRSILDRPENEVLPACSSAVMDVYDTFWVRDGALGPDLADVARRLVDDLNERIVAVPRPKLDQAREKVIVAGGELKYPGILAYLRQAEAIGIRATVLVTDAETAARLAVDLGPDAAGGAASRRRS